MPRLTVEAWDPDQVDDLNDLYEKDALGSDSFDFCSSCGEEWENSWIVYDEHPRWLALSIDPGENIDLTLQPIDHPPYDDFDYECVVCDKTLTPFD